jgi:AmmeMemoRadiSam system protein B
METRTAAFAGSWYPRQAEACRKEIQTYLAGDPDENQPAGRWSGGIVPHAGWVYSGRLACRVINRLIDQEPIDVVVVFGMHLHSGSPHHVMPHGIWETPLGGLPVAEDLAEHLLSRFKFKIETTDRHIQDNTIEVQLPFIKALLNPKSILGLGVPPAPQSIELGKTVGQWARDNQKRIRIIGSTDLTHYGPNYGFSPKGRGPQAVQWVRDQNDRSVIEAVLNLDPEAIIQEGLTRQNACCAGAVGAAVAAAKQMGMDSAREVSYATSYDISPSDSFVGYAGIVLGTD